MDEVPGKADDNTSIEDVKKDIDEFEAQTLVCRICPTQRIFPTIINRALYYHQLQESLPSRQLQVQS